MDKIQEKANRKTPIKLRELDFTPIIIAIGVILVTLIILFLWRKRRAARTDILLTGLCESGKTMLFTQILFSEAKETYTSMKENVGNLIFEKGQARLVDLPGHERLRLKFFEQYKSLAKVIVYVVDSATMQKDIRDVADFLYTILADNAVSSTPVIIACNKQDETLAKGGNVIKSLLEKELNIVRTTRASQLQSVDNSSQNTVFLGKQGRDFEFSHLSQSVEIVECSAKERDLENLNTLIKKLV